MKWSALEQTGLGGGWRWEGWEGGGRRWEGDIGGGRGEVGNGRGQRWEGRIQGHKDNHDRISPEETVQRTERSSQELYLLLSMVGKGQEVIQPQN